MAHISLRVSDEEKDIMEEYAKFYGISLSEAIKKIFFEKLEDEYDLRTIAEYETAKESGEVEYKTFDEVLESLDLENEI